jgi:hypothetical protein
VSNSSAAENRYFDGGRERAARLRPPAPATKGWARRVRLAWQRQQPSLVHREVGRDRPPRCEPHVIGQACHSVEKRDASPADQRPRTMITRAAASPRGANTRARARLVFNLDSIGICPLIGADQNRRAGDRHDANSPKRTWSVTGFFRHTKQLRPPRSESPQFKRIS